MAVRVFVVEDSRPMQRLVRDLLEWLGGFEVVGVAANETAATEWLLRHPGGWDLAIVDLLLAEGSGIALIARCSQGPHGTIIVFSDFVTPVVRQRCLHLGADGVISKAHFAELRNYLQAFPGRAPRAAAALAQQFPRRRRARPAQSHGDCWQRPTGARPWPSEDRRNHQGFLPMSQQQEQLQPEDGVPQAEDGQQQQQPQATGDAHAGQGSDSALKQMRIWEQNRATHSGGKRRQGPG